MLLTKEYKERIFSEFQGHKNVHLLMEYLDWEHFNFARFIIEEDITSKMNELLVILDESTYKEHNKRVEKIRRLRDFDYALTKLCLPEEKEVEVMKKKVEVMKEPND